jgi:hypothetical protein
LVVVAGLPPAPPEPALPDVLMLDPLAFVLDPLALVLVVLDVLPELLLALVVPEPPSPPSPASAPPSGVGMHAPDWQMPPVHGEPSCLAGVEQVPVEELQVPGSWQVSCAVQVMGFVPVQTPLWQVSVWVQALPSSQAGPERSAQVPSVSAPAATEQALQGPALQAVLQQTLSVQKPLWQSDALAHLKPVSMRYSSACGRGVGPMPPAIKTVPFSRTLAV